MQILNQSIDPFLSRPGIQGHGQGLNYKDKWYYYAGEKNVPKDKPAIKWEGNWAGRVCGEKEWIIVAWNSENFVLLDHTYCGIRELKLKYNRLLAIQAIERKNQEEIKLQKERDAMPKCKKCGKPYLEFGQKSGLCIKCDTNFS
jgi:hypothetical protein